MNRHSILNTTPEQPRPWLMQHYAATRQRTVDLVKMTVDRLIQDRQTVTIEAICKLSQQLDPQGKGIKKAGILGNAEAYAYYQQHRTSRRRTPGRASHRTVTTYRLPTDPQRGCSLSKPTSSPNSSSLDCNLNCLNSNKRCRRSVKTALFEALFISESGISPQHSRSTLMMFGLTSGKTRLW